MMISQELHLLQFQQFHQWRIRRRPSIPPSSSLSAESSSAALTNNNELMSAKERRQLRKERRESRSGDTNWREAVEERLLIKPKKEYKSWTEKLNLDNLSLLGTQWWVLRCSRLNGHDTAQILAKALVRNYPDFEFKVYFPAVKEKTKLKSGAYSTKMKPLFPGCLFLNCVMNKEIHDFIREVDGIGGFLGSKVGNTKRQINKPKPVALNEMEVIFRQAKEEQEKSDQAFVKEQQCATIASDVASTSNGKPAAKESKAKKQLRAKMDLPVPGASVRVLSGPFTEFTGRLKGLDRKNGKATVGFMLFGKESFVDLKVEQIVAETT